MTSPTQLVPGVFLVGLGQFQAYLVAGREGWTLIDCGLAGSGGQIRDAMERARPGVPLRQIVATHGHEDHVGSMAELAAGLDVITIAHRLDAPYIRGDAPMPPPQLTAEELPYFEAIQPNVVPAPPAAVVEEVEDGDWLDIGDGAVVIHTPGHTPGSIAIYLPEGRVLFTGDNIASVGATPILGPFNCDRAEAIRSFKRLAALDVRLACFGHGPPLSGEDASARLLEAAARLAA